MPAYAFWRSYLLPGLAEAGHEVIEPRLTTDWAGGLLGLNKAERRAWIDRTWSHTLEDIEKARESGGVDLVLTYLYLSQINTSAIREIRKKGFPVVNFFCDNVREFRRLPSEFSVFDAHWVPEVAALPLYREKGWRAVHAPMPCWIPLQKRTYVADERLVVSFIGSRDPLRAELLSTATRAELPLEIRGSGWLEPQSTQSTRFKGVPLSARVGNWLDLLYHQGAIAAWRRLSNRWNPPTTSVDLSRWILPMPDDDGYQELLASSAISLGINRYPSWGQPRHRPGVYSRLRDIEAPMLGACYLTEHTPDIGHLYDCETEVATYRDGDELLAKAQSLLSDPKRRWQMRSAARQRALAEHTIGQSIRRIADALGIGSTCI